MKTVGQPVNTTAIVREHWGANAPQWVRLLAQKCDEENQAKVASKISRSAALVNQVLRNKYTGNLSAVEKRVMAVFSCAGVECPVLGQITGSACLENQSRPYNNGNHLAVTLFTACQRCPHNLKNKDKKNA